VPSADAFLRSLALLLYPAPRGSGMKVKVLEAMVCGVPVVTTPAGAEGIDPTDGVVVCETPEALVEASARLLADPQERARRGAAAREAFLARYAPEPATRPLAGLFRRMAAAGAGS
jgi:glycosyltransferase involved in cell wall biosynthesis